MNKYINKIIKIAAKKAKKQEIPIVAMIFKKDKLIYTTTNNKNLKNNVLGHAEIICIQKASKKLKRWNLNDCTLLVTLKPCEMCQLVIREARIKQVYYLIDRLEYKKIYNKTIFKPIENYIEEKEHYKKILNSFFKNKR